jgi:4-hydroxy-tetrahydrodipicolinate reductase
MLKFAKIIDMSQNLKIAIIGYGKMGKMIEQVAIKRGHSISATIDHQSTKADWDKVASSDVAIEFSKPDVAVENILRCFNLNVPVVVGTTGWYNQIDMVKQKCNELKQAMLTATNFSIGVNLFFHINKILAQAMENLPEYDATIEETHHIEKLDAPSGTAITIAQGILAQIKRKTKWELDVNVSSDTDLSITSHRINDVPGTHIVRYSSEIDDIEIKHRAHSRSGFAIGAVVGAEWLMGHKSGCFTMSDLIGF